MNPDTLLPQHARLISGSAIAPEVAEARGYRSITRKVDLRELGFADRQCRIPALLIPVWGGSGEVATYQSRPDEPRINENGKAVKYETPSGTRMALDVHPQARQWIGDPSRPLLITEGVRKADAAVSKGLCCIALLGVWNWRGTNEHGGKTALADWEHIALNNRLVYICFDSDVMTKPEVHSALARLKAFLESKGARVLLIYLPPSDGAAKVGLDDYLAAGHSVDELLALSSPDPRTVSHTEGEELQASYHETSSGLVWLKPTANGVVSIPLTNFTARIISDVAEDDGAEARRFFEVEARLNGRRAVFAVPAAQFPAMNWAMEHLGAGAVIQPGFGLRDHARAAVQILSGEVPTRKVYSHTGWRNIDNVWVYLHAGGGISSDARVNDVEVRLPVALGRFELPDPPTGDQLRKAIRASLAFLDLAPDSVTFPIFAGIWSAATLQAADFSLHLAGPTGTGKSELAALAQQHWGHGIDARHLPGSWSSTANALEGLAFAAKDALLVVDDFAPAGALADVARMHREADRLLRAQGNISGRQRMRADASLAPAKPPRGLILSTGEDVPRGQSLRSRVIVLELSPNALDFERLASCQRDAATGLYAQAFAGFVRYMAGRLDTAQGELHTEIEELRQKAYLSGQHRRTPDIVARLALGMKRFLGLAEHVGALSAVQADVLWQRGWRALGEAAAAQASHQAAAEPVRRFLELISAAIASGRAHVASPDGTEPETPEAWGWRQCTAGAGDYQREEWRPQGQRIGWQDGEDLYLEPEASLAAVQSLARDTGDSLGIGSRTLRKRLHEQGLLASTEQDHGTLTVRRTLEGCRRSVLHLRSGGLTSQKTAQSAQPAQPVLCHGEDGQVPGQFEPSNAPETAHENRPSEPAASGAGVSMGGLGSLGGSGDDRHREVTGLGACYACRGTRYWAARSGGIACARCHPPADETRVDEYIEVGASGLGAQTDRLAHVHGNMQESSVNHG